jgi:hypothetical protein
MDRIDVYQNNSIVITQTVTDSDGTASDLSGFTITLYVRYNLSDATNLISSEGVVTDNVVVFTIDAADNTLKPGSYVYEIDAVSTDETLTLRQDNLIVKKSLL